MCIQRRFTLFLVAALLAMPAVTRAAGSCADQDLPPRSGFLDDRVLVRLSQEAADRAATASEERLPDGVPGLGELLARKGIREGRRLIRTYGVPIGDPDLFSSTGLDRWYVLLLAETGKERVVSLTRDLRQLSAVETVEVVAVDELSGIPNDSLFDLQWHHHNTGQTGGTDDADMDSPEAWDIGTGNPTGIVGLLDSGVEDDHEDLVGGIVAGYNFADDNEDTGDDNGHGTNNAGLVAARGNNSIGVAGICYDCMYMPLKVVGADLMTDLEVAVNAIRWGADSGADAIGSMSGYSYAYSQALVDAVEYAMGRGALILSVNGNRTTAQQMALSSIPAVVAVGATDHEDRRLLSYGDHLSVSSPGWDDYTTALNDSYGTLSGTCPAVALASGIAGLLRAEDESLHVNEMHHLLELGADDQVGVPEEDTPGWDRYMGYGRLNAHGSLALIDGPWLAMDRPHYLCAGEVTVALKDKTAGSSVDVTLTVGSGSDAETLTVLPLTDQGYFEGSIPISWAGKDGPAVIQDGKLDVAHGDTIAATVGDLSAAAFVDCVKLVCNVPNEKPVAVGDCDQDGVADPGELWSMGIAIFSNSTEYLPDATIVIESDDPYVEILDDTIVHHHLAYEQSYPDYVAGDEPAVIRMREETPFKHSALLRVTSIQGTGWENDPALCETYYGEPTISVLANRDLGPEQQRWDFDDGSAQGFTSEVAHGTGDLSECEATFPWRNEWSEFPVADRYHTGGYSMRIGNGQYYNWRNDAGLMTPEFDVSEDGGALAFYAWMNTYLYYNEYTWDGFAVEAKPTTESIWSYIPEGTYGFEQILGVCDYGGLIVPFGWAENLRLFAGDGEEADATGDQFDRQQLVLLDDFAGSTVQARFRFGSIYSDEGVWIDSVTVHPWVPDTWPGEAPANLQGSDAGCPASYDLTWDPVEGAGAYNVYRSELSCADADASLDAYGQSPTEEFSDTGVVEGVVYYYAVEALEAGLGCSSERACISGGCAYGSIAGTALLDGESDHGGIAISTLPASSTAVTGADGGYVLSSVPVGTYSVLATKDGWTEGRVDGVDVAAGQTTTGIDLLLDPLGGNLPPVAEDQSVDTFMNQAVTITLEASDPDEDPLTYFCVDLPANGMLSGCEDGDRYVTYTPDFRFTGIDTFTFKANDGALDSNLATVTVDVKKRGPGGG